MAIRNSAAPLFHARLSWLKWAGVGLFLGWVFFALAAYYAVNKPFTPDLLRAAASGVSSQYSVVSSQYSAPACYPVTLSPCHPVTLSSLGRAALDLLAAAWILFTALGLGAWLLGRLAPPLNNNLERFLFAAGLGLGSLGLLILGLGVAALLTRPILYAVITALTLLTGRPALRLLRQLRLPRLHLSSLILHPFFVLVIALSVTLTVTLSLLPPTAWDSLGYHLVGPKLYLQAGRLLPGIDNPALYFPSLLEMLFLLGIALRSDATAQLLHFAFLFLLAGIVYGLAQNFNSQTTPINTDKNQPSVSICVICEKNPGWTAVLFLFALPMVSTLAAWSYTDLALAFYEAAALYAFLQWHGRGGSRTAPTGRWLVLAGIFCGLAMGLKYTSFIAPLILTLLMAWGYRHRPLAALKPLLTFIIPALLVAAPWYIKNAFYMGNPIYPFVFGGRLWDDFRAAMYTAAGTGIGLDPIALLRLPFDLMLGLKDASQDAQTGPIFLAFLPLLLVYGFSGRGKGLPAAFGPLLLFAAVLYTFWTAGVINTAGLWQSRQLLPAFVMLCPALAWALQDLGRFDHPQFSLRRFLFMVLGVVLLLGLVYQALTWSIVRPYAYLSGAETREVYLRRQLGAHYAAIEAVNALPAGANVVFLWEPRTYYCRVECQADLLLDRFPHLEYLYGDAGAIAAAWREQGVTHVLLFQAGLDFLAASGDLPPSQLALLQSLQAEYLRPAGDLPAAYRLYELRP